MGLGICLITAYLVYSEAVFNCSEITTLNIIELNTIYHLPRDRGFTWLPKPLGVCFRAEYFSFSLCLAFSSALEGSISCVDQQHCSFKPTASSSAITVSHTILLSICLHRSLRPLAFTQSQTWSSINRYLCRAALATRAGFSERSSAKLYF